MEYLGVLFSLFFAIVITAIFSIALKKTGPWGGFWVFFILMFFVSLAAGEWAAQRGPSAWGYYWAPGLMAAIVTALILAAATPGSHKERAQSKLHSDSHIKESTEVAVTTAIFGVFLWILIALLAFIAIAGLLSRM